MCLRVVALVALVALAEVGCLADSDSVEGAMRKCREDMENAGYKCVGSVGVEERPFDFASANALVAPRKGGIEFTKISRAVENLWTKSGWGRPEDAEAISFLEDGTMCIRWKNSTTAKQPTTSGLGRRLFRHSVGMPEPRNAGGSRLGNARRLSQDFEFAPELQIPDGEEQIRVPPGRSLEAPFSMVGNVGEGCTGILVGPCHYLTAAHCVFDHELFQVIGNTGFNPGRNGIESLFPLGRYQAVRVFPTKQWTLNGDSESDAAIVQVQGRPGDDIG